MNIEEHSAWIKKRANFFLFLIGTFSMTQIRIIGSIGISELVMILAAPFVYCHDYKILRHDGFNWVLFYVTLTCCSCIASSWYNDTPFAFAIRGFASPFVILATIIVVHRYLRQNLNGLKWILLGMALSTIINVFVFQSATEAYIASMRGESGVEGVVSGPLFWIGRISNFASLPMRGWFLQTPYLITLLTPVALSAFAIFSSASGRAAALMGGLSFVMLLLGGKTRLRMLRLQRNFVVLIILMGIAGFAMKVVYSKLAESGHLGETALLKYEAQTKHGNGALSLIVAGRADCFVGLMACMDKPILGHGPWAVDTENYYERFLRDYGAPEDYDMYYKEKYERARLGYGEKIGIIPGHSHFISGWLWYGLPGLVMWIYVFIVGISVVRKYMVAIPQWFGYFVAVIPGMLWNFFFSPPGSRVQDACMIVCFLLARSVGQGRLRLPFDMEREIAICEGKR